MICHICIERRAFYRCKVCGKILCYDCKRDHIGSSKVSKLQFQED